MFINTYKSLRLIKHSEEEKTSKSSKSYICSSVSVHNKGTLKCVLQLRSRLLNDVWNRLSLPEGVSEVHAPPLQLLGVVRRHVGKLPEDVEVRGVSW